MLIPLIVACALFMENLDSTVLATSLPAIAHAFGESPLKLNLAITSYLFALAVFIPISGWMADRFGTRTVFRAAIIVFTVGSILCGISESFWELVGARVLQGMGGAMMAPVGRLLVIRSTSKSELVRAMAFLMLPALLGPVIGPPLGGFLTTYLSWRWIFWINVPIGIIGVILVSIYIPNTRAASVPPLDYSGFLLSSLSLLGLVFGFETIGRDLMPAWISWGLMVGGAIGLWLYLRHARRTEYPVLDFRLLQVQTFRVSVTAGTLFRIGVGAIPFLLPLMLQVGFGLSAFQSGMLTFASAVGALAMKTTAAPILRRFGFRRVLLANAVISGSFIAILGFFRPDWPAWVILGLLLVGGFFRSLQFTAMNTIVYADIPPERMSAATSFYAMAQQVTLSAGVAVGAMVLHITATLAGDRALVPGDFTPAFVAVGLAAMCSVLLLRPLPKNAGEELSGHRLPPPK
ncbi:MAG: DHA2 family efflux MFS transporter permease subunit [Ferrovibrio sp.]|nr:DHA2 family efflux MFS transporter permease subunit [Ferrovibrio sp.]